MQAQLEAEDKAINALYSRMIETANLKTGEELRAAQRQWLRDRNATCNLAPGSTNSADWIAVLAQEPSKALCVYGSTHARLEQLRNQSVANLQISDNVIERHEISVPINHNTGKWYAEATFVAGGYRQDDKQYMQIGVASDKMMFGMQVFRSEMRRQGTGVAGEYVVGLAVDLDNGKMYWSENGTWRGSPGSTDGVTLARGDAYALRIISGGPSISRDLDLGLIAINSGQAPFVHPTPAGYKPYFAPPANAAAPRLDWLVPSYKKVAGLSLPEWTERYWSWLLLKPPTRSPTEDTTGEFCADNQSGPVWFLAGGDAKSRIERTCRVPKGKFLLLPALVQVVFPRQAQDLDVCTRFADNDAARDGADAIQNAYVSIDGARFDALHDHRVFRARCAPIRGSAGEIVVENAVFWGVLVVLQPLPEGEHVISFGGDLAALNNYRNVSYRITVN